MTNVIRRLFAPGAAAIWIVVFAVVMSGCEVDTSTDTAATQPTATGAPSDPATIDATTPTARVRSPEGKEPSEEGFVPPQVSPPVGAPFYEGGIQHFEYIADCVEDAGFFVTFVPEQKIIVYEGDDPVYNTVSDRCYIAAIEQGWVVPSPFSGEDGLRLRYRLWTVTHTCLTHHGYPTNEPPSEDSFVAENGRNWHPYEALPTPGLLVVSDGQPVNDQDRFQLEVQAECPADPSDLLWRYEQENGHRP